MTGELIVLLGDNIVGLVHQNKQGRLKFTYDNAWREAEGAYPLSLSMPLAASEHGHAVIDAFIWGLLPDNEFVLGQWAKKFQVSARNAFALISNVGEDCAGAVQFVRPELLEEVRTADGGAVEWIDDDEIARRLTALRGDHSAWRRPQDTGQFSLAGAQPKTALLLDAGKWGVPSGRIPTTHILKPPTGEFDGHAENEHFCLSLARRLDLPTASSSVMRFDDEIAIVIERYDRQKTNKGVIRVHQEDVCQALGLPPTKKYQNEGGPGVAELIELLGETSTAADEDINTVIKAMALNWIIAGTDAHAKNYSVLIGAAGRARLAPLYDIASALPYDDFDFQKLKLAMKIGGEYRIRDVRKRQWEKFAQTLKLSPDRVLTLVSEIVTETSAATEAIRDDIRQEGLDHPIIDRMSNAIIERSKTCLRP
ncbi:MAG: type II toxin-antitoxin system HipA family toxin [Oricola sp.]|jgi:serine/threonine-protein kinase HipA|uniref:type II toxin-antitoxin system HipA family toxin n=1 Tax=Hyphococcus sp. TaxID=2038636 RepID=UPI00320BD33A|nr:type II toxin-antitoxin system HipA family toxin [Oricola sp.]